jgi:pilus assembly protein FimV
VLPAEERDTGESLEELSLEEPGIDEIESLEELSAPETGPDAGARQPGSEVLNEDLKSEIKSILSYFNQLLEDLPEAKIKEFAQSEYFIRYKRLFEELGLEA